MDASATTDAARADEVTVQEHRGRAMGTSLHIVVVGRHVVGRDAAGRDDLGSADGPSDPEHPELASMVSRGVSRIAQLEARWSRFLPNSEVSRCNSTRGIPVDVSVDTRNLVRHAIHGWRESGGAYDPTIFDALIANGYDRSYDEMLDCAEGTPDSLGNSPGHDPWADEPTPAPGCDGIEIDDEIGSVTLPIGTGFDPGGLGKGLAADLVVEELIKAGAPGAMVNLGGDLRVAGDAPTSDGWVVEIAEPTVQVDPIGLAVMIDGGLATSTTRRRVWTVDGRSCHHVIDPRVGRPVESQAQLATVITGRAWWSEILATQLLLSPIDRWADVTGDSASMVVDTDGNVHTFGTMKDHLR